MHRGAGAYICGEETGLIESLEGKRPYPRIKPPYFPAVLGLYLCPTIVNNVETLCHVRHIVTMGSAAYAKLGTPNNTGTRIVSLEIGMVTPPIGLNLFVTAGITRMSIMEVARAALPWSLVLLLFLVIVTYVPALTLFLPPLARCAAC